MVLYINGGSGGDFGSGDGVDVNGDGRNCGYNSDSVGNFAEDSSLSHIENRKCFEGLHQPNSSLIIISQYHLDETFG